jgi:hypothetical protein
MLGLLVGVAAVVYEIYIVATKHGEMTQSAWGQSAAIAAVGFYCVISNREKLYGLFTALKSKVKTSTKVEVQPNVEPENGEEMADKNYKLSEKEQCDFECMMYLRARITEIGDAEGIDAFNKLNQIMFALKAAKAEVKNEVV